jgi:glutamate dehydrogenase (NAD(P)+)
MANQRINVLLVEDNPVYSRLIQKLLAKSEHQHFEVAVASTLESAIERLAVGGIDVVLLDLMLPDSAALDTFYRLRAHGSARSHNGSIASATHC